MNLVIQNPSLVTKFQEAAVKKTSIDDFTKEFLSQFLSEETKIAYVKDLQFFFDFLRSGKAVINHPADIQAFHFRLYRDSLIERNLSSATINRRLVCIRSFVKWAIAAKLMDSNPLDCIKLPKVQTESPTVAFEDTEVVAMISAPDVTTHKGRTARLAMVLLFSLGLRRSELTNIMISDIYEDRGHFVLKITGKAAKIRLIPLNDFVRDEISRYSSNLGLKENDFLLQTEQRVRNTKAIDGSTIYRIIERYSEQLGIDKKVSPHSCRATLISHLLDTQKAGIREVATLAGHSNITTTERYDKRRNQLENSPAYMVKY